jgi:2-polyprenyl-3-methyl-5-hydroxy-6-metoxy-1,4-benzoquinol methylase
VVCRRGPLFIGGANESITPFEVLEHVDHPRAILEMLRALVVRGGILVLETPDCSGITDIVSRQD